ncbi:MAG: 23S rRNA (pseudouridine(1915)-N(3))-methyltransferase RlmH [Blastocatellia bacterium]|nr:23S rRNA (pseudouridine(1915)-N(3))-methyltransferase RlmH [Blastocatellia bacterium]MCS7157339.1 23S rRNA (pseudouridine(1915)-N(3))-methyltransferase RlmH [Blastocatellia bacterium]MCX7753205.1 23S rRNA (pseudouridine(1915)-N(3))-methyltransferase RlmH [Blastocatellia bacterium]MDW8168243.1 23S rRNA (pseudouridine(1915)-N(3))-methyltransferase RlmH [Acidobacteriota bacterium]MDW8255463.1 23S rRNA (pseudouridine(1915)-N(3))-methyltransferase RlmH [Acidobacteriota bacterium]
MYLEFLWVGKTKNAHLAALEQDYVRRLQRFVPVQIRALRAISEPDPKRLCERESVALLGALRPGFRIILLDERGKMFSSWELAEWLRAQQRAGTPGLCFLVGGPEGVSESVRERADERWSLSRLTLPHELVRVILLEQIYRAFAIIFGLPYPR